MSDTQPRHTMIDTHSAAEYTIFARLDPFTHEAALPAATSLTGAPRPYVTLTVTDAEQAEALNLTEGFVVVRDQTTGADWTVTAQPPMAASRFTAYPTARAWADETPDAELEDTDEETPRTVGDAMAEFVAAHRTAARLHADGADGGQTTRLTPADVADLAALADAMPAPPVAEEPYAEGAVGRIIATRVGDAPSPDGTRGYGYVTLDLDADQYAALTTGDDTETEHVGIIDRWTGARWHVTDQGADAEWPRYRAEPAPAVRAARHWLGSGDEILTGATAKRAHDAAAEQEDVPRAEYHRREACRLLTLAEPDQDDHSTGDYGRGTRDRMIAAAGVHAQLADTAARDARRPKTGITIYGGTLNGSTP